jgi:colicin import membrane protein
MSVAVYSEPYKFPASVLALAVHGAFFALLYFGFSWQTQPVAMMSVDLWQSLPDAAPPVQPHLQPAPPPKVEEPVPPPQPQKEVKPDIALPDKKKIIPKPVAVKSEPKPKPVAIKPAPTKQVAPKQDTSAEEQVVREQVAREQTMRDQAARDQAAATGRVVDEYVAKIQGKIKRNIVMPPNVADDARAEFLVTLLPGGSVLKAELKKSSGNEAYDNAVERAILKSQPLPLPADVAMFNRFRELKLGFRPKE